MPPQCRSPVDTTMSRSVVPGESSSRGMALTGTLSEEPLRTSSNSGC